LPGLVTRKGVGLMMLGGTHTFANDDWTETTIAELLPVELNVKGQVTDRVRMVPTPGQGKHYVLQLGKTDQECQTILNSLELDGMTQMGRPREGATVLAQTDRGTPVLVYRQVDAGRVLAFAGDSTWKWIRPPDGHRHHARFWQQLVLFLAKQEEPEGSVW